MKFPIENIKTLPSLLSGAETELKSRGEVPEVSISTLPKLNFLTWGLPKGMTVIGARTSNCKSALGIQFALDFAQQGIDTVIMSLEMDETSIIERMFCNEMEINNFDLKRGWFKREPITSQWTTFKAKIETLPLLITCGIGKTFSEVNTFIEILSPKPKVVILDYIQMAKALRNEREELSEYIRQFRALMVLNNMRGIVCSQVNRMVEKDNDYRPRLENLKSTGCIHPNSIVDGKTILERVEGKINEPITSYDILKKKMVKQIPSRYIHSGKKKCLLIKTKSGKEIILSKGTQLYDGKVWRQSKTYEVGEKILVETYKKGIRKKRIYSSYRR